MTKAELDGYIKLHSLETDVQHASPVTYEDVLPLASQQIVLQQIWFYHATRMSILPFNAINAPKFSL